jgi:hypothetical protein
MVKMILGNPEHVQQTVADWLCQQLSEWCGRVVQCTSKCKVMILRQSLLILGCVSGPATVCQNITTASQCRMVCEFGLPHCSTVA